MKSTSEFGLSRIQAEGWNAAHKFLIGGDPSDVARIAALNPHTGAAERERWYAGFNSALNRP
jgi:hypothetical protein